MSFTVITNPSFAASSGFTQSQFKKLDDLYCRAAAAKVLTYRTVDCDFEAGVACYTYYQSQAHAPCLTFKIIRMGPKDMMYEVYKQGQGRIAKSGIFDRAFKSLRDEINKLG
ncbi:MAG: hypothetical protein ACT4OY_07795 [Alphaproteobacteria bacterium]